ENENVLNALSQVGLPKLLPDRTIWIARGKERLEVDWPGISGRGETRTNFQLQSGDRVHVGKRPVALDVAAPAPSRLAAIEPCYIATREFTLPFVVADASLKPGDTFSVYVSRDKGRTWYQEIIVSPREKKVQIDVKQDGEYWFGIARAGQLASPDPSLRVVVDTKAPVVVVRPWETGDARGFEWAITDDNLDLSSLSISYREAKNADWQPLAVTQAATGRAALRGRTDNVEIRVTVRDKASNRADVTFPYGEMVKRASGKIVLSPPEPATSRDEVWIRLGIRARPADASQVKRAAPLHAGGMNVTDVRSDSPAARAGLKPGDI